jgi:hypothetical protein
LAVAAYIANGLNSQDLRMPVAEELLGLLPHALLNAATAACQHGTSKDQRKCEDEGAKLPPYTRPQPLLSPRLAPNQQWRTLAWASVPE